MTTLDVLRTLGRRWYVVVLGLLVTGAVIGSLHARAGVYATDAEVYLIAPSEGPNSSAVEHGATQDSLVAMAGLVEHDVNRNQGTTQAVSPDVSIADLGIYRGVMVVLPNFGGQWNELFTSPVLRVSAAGATPQEAASDRDEAIRRITTSLRTIQVDDGVAASRRIKTRLVPDTPVVRYEIGKPQRAMAAAGLVGLGITCAVCVQLDRLLLRRKRRFLWLRRGAAVS